MRSVSPGSLSLAKLVMMSSAPAKFAGDARYAFKHPSFNERCPIFFLHLFIYLNDKQTNTNYRTISDTINNITLNIT